MKPTILMERTMKKIALGLLLSLACIGNTLAGSGSDAGSGNGKPPPATSSFTDAMRKNSTLATQAFLKYCRKVKTDPTLDQVLNAFLIAFYGTLITAMIVSPKFRAYMIESARRTGEGARLVAQSIASSIAQAARMPARLLRRSAALNS